MTPSDLGLAADKLRRLAQIELAEGDGPGSRETQALAHRLTDTLNRPGNLAEAMRGFVEATLHLGDVWRDAGSEAAFVLGDSYGLVTDFDEIAARAVDWDIPEGKTERTHALLPVEVIERLAHLLQRLGDLLESGEWDAGFGPQVAECYAEALGLGGPDQAVAELHGEPLHAQRALVATLLDATDGLRTRDWPA